MRLIIPLVAKIKTTNLTNKILNLNVNLNIVCKKGSTMPLVTNKGSIILLVAKKGSTMSMAILHEGPGPASKSKSQYKEVRNPLQIKTHEK